VRKLFLDDIRLPIECVSYMYKRIGSNNSIYLENDWIIVRTYDEFIKEIINNGLPDICSFDHDLADEHIQDYYKKEPNGQLDYHKYKERTGFDCAKWLVEHCINNSLELPKYIIHSWNPIGAKNIQSILDTFKKFSES